MEKVPATAEVLTIETNVKLVGRSDDRQGRSQRSPVSFESDTQSSTQVQNEFCASMLFSILWQIWSMRTFFFFFEKWHGSSFRRYIVWEATNKNTFWCMASALVDLWKLETKWAVHEWPKQKQKNQNPNKNMLCKKLGIKIIGVVAGEEKTIASSLINLPKSQRMSENFTFLSKFEIDEHFFKYHKKKIRTKTIHLLSGKMTSRYLTSSKCWKGPLKRLVCEDGD